MKPFTPRTTAPSRDNKNYIKTTHGGYNYAMEILNGDVLPNCVGYAWGRRREILGTFHELSRGNAEVWWGKHDGYKRSQTPSVGDIACWKQGNAGDGRDGAGHVAVVEEVYPDGSILTSNSAYKGSRFYMRTIKAPYEINRFQFQGFIKMPDGWKPGVETPKGKSDAEHKQVAEGIYRDKDVYAKYGNNPGRAIKLKAEGFEPAKVQRYIQEIIQNGSKPSKPKGKSDAEHKKIAEGIVRDKEVYAKYGNNPGRAVKLKADGFEPAKVQRYINQLLRK